MTSDPINGWRMAQYVPDVLANPDVLRAVAPVPFVPAPLDQPSARRQYIPDVLANPVALGAVAPVAWSLAALNGIDSRLRRIAANPYN
jgi:hypothetical protein